MKCFLPLALVTHLDVFDLEGRREEGGEREGREGGKRVREEGKKRDPTGKKTDWK